MSGRTKKDAKTAAAWIKQALVVEKEIAKLMKPAEVVWQPRSLVVDLKRYEI